MNKITILLLALSVQLASAQNLKELQSICEKENTSISWNHLAKYYFDNNEDIELIRQTAAKAYELATEENNDKQTGIALLLLAEIDYSNQLDIYISEYEKGIRYFQKAKEPMLECEALSQIGYAYNVMGQYDKSIEYFKKAEQLFTGTEFKNRIAPVVYINMGFAYLYKGRSDSAISFISEANKVALISKDTTVLIECNNQLGIIHRRNGNYASALEHFNESLRLYEMRNNDKAICITLANIASLYSEWRKDDKALYFEREALKYALKYPREVNNLGRVFNDLGIILCNNKQYKSALDTLLIAKPLVEGNDNATYVNSLFISSAYFYLNQHDSADVYLNNAGLLLEKDKNLPAFRYYRVKGSHLARRGHYQEAIPILEKYVEVTQSGQRQYIFGEYEIYNLLAVSFEKGPKDYKKALYYKEMAYNYRDSLYKKEHDEAIGDFYVKYQTAEKELQITKLNHERQKMLYDRALMVSIFIIVAILLSFAWLYSRFLTMKRTKESVELKRKMDEKENDYQSLLNDIELRQMKHYLTGLEAERERLAKELHDNVLNGIFIMDMELKANKQLPDTIHVKMENLYTQIRNISHDLMPPVFQYAALSEAIDNYLILLNEQSGISFELVIEGEETEIPQNIAFEIYRIIQETTSNIMKHAKAQNAIITIYILNNHVELTVEDDGRGFDIHGKKEGIGLQIIEDRCKSINGKLHIHSGEGKGCRIEISIPFNQQDVHE